MLNLIFEGGNANERLLLKILCRMCDRLFFHNFVSKVLLFVRNFKNHKCRFFQRSEKQDEGPIFLPKTCLFAPMNEVRRI